MLPTTSWAPTAARPVGCDRHTVKKPSSVAAGLPPDAGLEPGSIINPFRPKIEESVDRSQGRIRADVVHDKLVETGFGGTERTTRRAVEEAKKAFAAGRRRVYRPWITETACWLQFDWGWGPEFAGRATLLFCAWLAWSRFRVVDPDVGLDAADDAVVPGRGLPPDRGVPTYT